MSIQVGDRVIHNGTEKSVSTVNGDVLILSDGIVVAETEVSPIPRSQHREATQAEDVSPEVQTNRADLRRSIEGLDQNTPVSTVMRVMGQVDSGMVINTTVNWDLFKTDIIRRALELRKIDPKVCEHCNQIIPE